MLHCSNYTCVYLFILSTFLLFPDILEASKSASLLRALALARWTNTRRRPKLPPLVTPSTSSRDM